MAACVCVWLTVHPLPSVPWDGHMPMPIILHCRAVCVLALQCTAPGTLPVALTLRNFHFKFSFRSSNTSLYAGIDTSYSWFPSAIRQPCFSSSSSSSSIFGTRYAIQVG
jgi:hypothetical protein